MRNLFTAYRVLAMIVGVLLTVLVFVAVPLKYFPADGTSLQHHRRRPDGVRRHRPRLDLHGLPGRRVRAVPPAAVGLAVHRPGAAGRLVPILIFWVEHRVTQRVRGEHPELAAAGV